MSVYEGDFFFKCFKKEGVAASIGITWRQWASCK